MNKTDQPIVFILILLIVMHLSIAVFGFLKGRFLFYATILNFTSGVLIIIYWLQKQLRVEQHIFEQREFVVLSLELVMTCCAVASFFTIRYTTFFKAVQYSFFTIHSLLLILGLIFMLTFEMNKII